MLDTYFCGLEDEFFDFCDSVEYVDGFESPYSNESDQENINYHNQLDHSVKRLSKAPPKKVHQRTAANMRERRRMKSINDAFDHLRTCIPATVNADRRLSKVDTLRLAMSYINYLSNVIQTCGECDPDGSPYRNDRVQEKVILRCNFAENLEDDGGNLELFGHSLSWTDDKLPIRTRDNKLKAPLWFPDDPSDADILSLSSISNGDYR